MNVNSTLKPAQIIRNQEPVTLNVFGVNVTILGAGKETAGAFSMAKIVCPPGVGAPPHIHLESEHFHVLRGQLTIWLAGETVELDPGDTIHIPSKAPHTFSNNSRAETEFLSLASPAGHENFFRDADELSRSGQFNPATAAELCRKHEIELL